MASDRVERAVEATLGTRWDDLGLLEHKGKLLLPVSVRRRTRGGELAEKPYALQLPEARHRSKARVQARKWAAELALVEGQDGDLIGELENYWLLAFALREPKAPHDQVYPDGPSLYAAIEHVSLREVWTKLDLLSDILDPRFGELSDDEMWALIDRVAARGDPSPLAECDSLSQATCIAFMARVASRSRIEKS